MSPPRLRSSARKQTQRFRPEGQAEENEYASYHYKSTKSERPAVQPLKRTKRREQSDNDLRSPQPEEIEERIDSAQSSGAWHQKRPSVVATPQFVSFANTADLLIHLSTRIIELMNERNYNSPFLNCLAPDVQSPNNSGRAKVIEGFRQMFENLPDCHNEIQNTTCTVDDDNGKAKVVMTMRVSGYVYGTLRQSVCLFTWTRIGDRWSCSKYRVMRGIEEFD